MAKQKAAKAVGAKKAARGAKKAPQPAQAKSPEPSSSHATPSPSQTTPQGSDGSRFKDRRDLDEKTRSCPQVLTRAPIPNSPKHTMASDILNKLQVSFSTLPSSVPTAFCRACWPVQYGILMVADVPSACS
jgi:hypothetical protein